MFIVATHQAIRVDAIDSVELVAGSVNLLSASGKLRLTGYANVVGAIRALRYHAHSNGDFVSVADFLEVAKRLTPEESEGDSPLAARLNG